MTQPATALLEAGRRAVRRAFGITIGVTQVAKARIGDKLPGHPLGVILPVGRHVNHRARFKQPVYKISKSGVDDAALVMALLVPGIGEEKQNPVQRFGFDHMLQHLDGVVIDQAHVFQSLLVNPVQASPDTGFVHFDPYI